MRILFVGHSSGMLGAERSLTDIVTEAVTDGHEVTVALPGLGPLVDVLRAAGARVALLPLHSWLGVWHWVPPLGLIRLLQTKLDVHRLEDLIREVAAEVVVTNTSVVPAGAAAAARAGVPHIWIVRESLRDNSQLRSAMSKRRIARTIVSGSDVLCTISPYVEDQVFCLAGQDHPRAVHVSPNPASKLSAALPPPGGTPRTILLPGYFSREKGQHRAIAALYLARRRGVDARLRLVGRGTRQFTVTLRLLTWMLGLKPVVEIIGWTDELQAEYARAHFVLTASHNEAFGRTVVESFANGRPVIGLNRGATEMLLARGGGMLVRPGTVRRLGQAMAKAGAMEPTDYDQLCRRAAERGDEFRRGASQYTSLRAAIQLLWSTQTYPEA